MRLLSPRSAPVLVTFFAACSLLAGCPEKGAPADKTAAEPEPVEPDDQGKLDAKAKKPAAGAEEEQKADDGKEEGGW